MYELNYKRLKFALNEAARREKDCSIVIKSLYRHILFSFRFVNCKITYNLINKFRSTFYISITFVFVFNL